MGVISIRRGRHYIAYRLKILIPCAIILVLCYANISMPARRRFGLPNNNAKISTKNVTMSMSTKYLSKADVFTDDLWQKAWGMEAPQVGAMEKLDPKPGKLQVIILAHSHVDPGWLMTFEEYANKQTRNILSNMVAFLSQHSDMKFIWSEMSFLHFWWVNHATQDEKEKFVRLLSTNQLQLTSGGWVMPDEAITLYPSLIDNLLEGHDFINSTFEYTVRDGWSVDPFGHSPAVTFLSSWSGIENIVVERIHYRMKMALRKQKDLVFKWRQIWDSDSSTDVRCHMLPSNSYVTPANCGPDSNVCQQFSFRNSMIQQSQFKSSAQLLADQLRRLAAHFKEPVVLVPYGGDFEFSSMAEWSNLHASYRGLMDYMNKNMDFEISFGTLRDYFHALDSQESSKPDLVLSGDFFPYSDRWKNHWVGFFASHPVLKKRERELAAILRTTNILTSIAIGMQQDYNIRKNMVEWFSPKLEVARRNLALFQHHDAITGTSKAYVMKDYAERLLSSIKNCSLLSSSATSMILESSAEVKQNTGKYIVTEVIDDIYSRKTHRLIKLTAKNKVRLVVFNSLASSRQEIVTVKVDCLNVQIIEMYESTNVPLQIDPLIDRNRVVQGTFLVHFVVKLNSLSFASFDLLCLGDERPQMANFGQIFTEQTVNEEHKIFGAQKLGEDVTELCGGNICSYHDSQSGSLNSIKVRGNLHSVTSKLWIHEDNGGAYLFRPGKNSKKHDENLKVWVIKGPITQRVIAFGDVIQRSEFVVSNNTGSQGLHWNLDVDVNTMKGMNLAIQLQGKDFSNEENTFFTDANGLYLTKRTFLDKIPREANYFPLASAAALEGKYHRLTVLSGQMGAVTAHPKDGMLDVIIDRVLSSDEGLGLTEALRKSPPSSHNFIINIEQLEANRNSKLAVDYLSLASNLLSRQMLNPLQSFTRSTYDEEFYDFSSEYPSFSCDIHLVNIRPYAGRRLAVLHRSLISSSVVNEQQDINECVNADITGFEDNLSSLLWLIGSDRETKMVDILVKQRILTVPIYQEDIEPMHFKAYLT